MPRTSGRRRLRSDGTRTRSRSPRITTSTSRDDRDTALEESKRFLDTYYSTDWDPEYVAAWTAAGTARDCVEHLRPYFEVGVSEVALRITSWDQRGQLARLIAELAPMLEEITPLAA